MIPPLIPDDEPAQPVPLAENEHDYYDRDAEYFCLNCGQVFTLGAFDPDACKFCGEPLPEPPPAPFVDVTAHQIQVSAEARKLYPYRVQVYRDPSLSNQLADWVRFCTDVPQLLASARQAADREFGTGTCIRVTPTKDPRTAGE